MPGVDPSPAAVVRPASIPELDGARAVAALGVFIFHAATAATPLNKHVFRLTAILNSGVGVFFVLSGFLIYRPFCEVNVAGLRTLQIEMTFYVLAPLFAILVRLAGAGLRRATDGRVQQAALELAATLTLAVAGILAIPWHSPEAHSLVRLMLPWMGELGTGMALAVLVTASTRHDWARAARAALSRVPMFVWLTGAAAMIVWLGLTTVNGWFCVFCTSPHQHVLQDRLTVPLAVLFVTPLVIGGRPGLARRTLASRPFVWLGVVSYSFYLWHQPIIKAVPKRWYALHGPWASFATISLELGLSLVAAAISFRFVERPGILLGRRFRGLRRAGQVTPAPAP
jgi:peptidoglycan/LPS O-acetylase OafA/YrhL